MKMEVEVEVVVMLRPGKEYWGHQKLEEAGGCSSGGL